MLLPLGDNVEKRGFPLGLGSLIGFNLLAAVYTARVALDDTTRNSEELMAFYTSWGLVPSNFLNDGAFVGLIGHMFLHGSFFHILGNLVVLFAFGRTVEEGIGTKRFLGLYFTTGFIAAMGHVFMNSESTVPLIGASGAIAGIIGAYCLAYGPTTQVKCLLMINLARPSVVHVPGALFAMFWLYMQWSGYSETLEIGENGVAWIAHVAGFFGGMALWNVFKDPNKMIVDVGGGVKQMQTIVDPEAEAAMIAAQALAEQEAAGPKTITCLYCGTELGEDDMIADQLYKCSNVACQRMNIDNGPAPEPKPEMVYAD